MGSSSDPSAFEGQIRDLLTADPGLPRANPTLPFWQQPPHPGVSTVQSKVLPSETDVVVIGSGVTACSVTKSLLEEPSSFGPSLHVTVLEARTLVSGATGRNGGHCVSAAGHTFSDLAARLGTERATEIVRFSLRNVDRLPEVVAGLDPAVREASELRPVKRLGSVADEAVWKHHQDSVLAFNEAVPERKDHHRLLSKAEVEEEWGLQGVLGGIGQKTAYALWPYRLFTGIFQQLLTRYPDRLAIETNTPVLSVSEISPSQEDDSRATRYLVTTSRGTIKTMKVIYCTNAYTSHLLPRLRGKLYPLRGHVSTQAPGSKFPTSAQSRSWSRMDKTRFDPTTGAFHYGLYYLQQNAVTKDVFVGVENEKMTDCLSSDDTTVSPIPRHDLASILPRMFSALNNPASDDEKPKIKSIWSGIIGLTADGLPLVGRLPQSATGRTAGGEEWIAAGFNGYGMDKCWLTGEALVAMMAAAAAGKEGQAVPTWFPKAYLITEERLDKNMKVDEVAKKYASFAADFGKDRSS